MTRTVTTSLADLMQPHFSSGTRAKGASYFSGGGVVRFRGDSSSIDASVQGTRRYKVALNYEPAANLVRCSCTCSAFDDSGACKHLWAVILTAQEHKLLSAACASRCKSMVPVWADNDDSDKVDEEGDIDDDGIELDLGGGEKVMLRGGSDVLAKLSALTGITFPGQSRVQSSPSRSSPALPPKPADPPAWMQTLARIGATHRTAAASSNIWRSGRQVLYIIDVSKARIGQQPAVEVALQDRKANGDWSKPKNQRISVGDIRSAPDLRDRQALKALYGLRGGANSYGYSHAYHSFDELATVIPLHEGSLEFIVRLLCDTGRCWLRKSELDDTELTRLTWDDGPPWRLAIHVGQKKEGGDYEITGQLQRDDQVLPVTTPHLFLRGGVMFAGEVAVRFDDGGTFEWITELRTTPTVRVPRRDGSKLAETLALAPGRVPVQLPSDLAFEEVQGNPRPLLKLVKASRYRMIDPASMYASVEFDYEGRLIDANHTEEGFFSAESRRLIRRNRAAETTAIDDLLSLGFRRLSGYVERGRELEVKVKKLPPAVAALVAKGWRVEAEGKPYRSAGSVDIKISSGIDWFELSGQARFDDQTVELPQLLAALRRNENTIVLGDGTIGMLPEEWLRKYGTLAALGTEQDEHLRFSQCQVGLLDALLASMPEATCDEVFEQARERLRRFDGVKPAAAPAGFLGELRPYQCEGLGWLQFLREFRFGGCLADDMGLGKTVQVLAMLEARRQEKLKAGEQTPLPPGTTPPAQAVPPRPSLVVVPRSLVFNWRQEAAKFAPSLQILDHTGIDRLCRNEGDHTAELSNYDVILTTYGTLRSDAVRLKNVRFDYLILDEAQAIKNASTASAKAVRLLEGEHRLVMTGTPVENRLGDLWSLFEFLNPGMLGSANVFRQLGGGEGAGSSPEARQMLGRALRPFILRRKKDQVAKDLPARVEQTIYCDLEPKQRKLYDQLREHYRKSLLAKVAKDGVNKSKMHVLEALLRLRQAACHPGLIDKAMSGETSAKLDALMPQLIEVIEEGHKALVFSQFTSMLAILRQRLDSENITYEYLDGKTHDRQARVDRFQSDPKCPLFLISLKAGGVGLNLTAAEHVFLLDPWWNPAVEAQAIDRAHRIGQARQVFAFRLIARNTVEEKVLELQNTKRELADAIIGEDNSLISKLGRAELELLLS